MKGHRKCKGKKDCAEQAPQGVEKPGLNVDIDEETEALVLPEAHYLRLMYAESRVKLVEKEIALTQKDLRIVELSEQKCRQDLAMLAVQKSSLGADAQNHKAKLKQEQSEYASEVAFIQEDTGLDLSKCTIDDDRVIRFVEDMTNCKEG